MGIAALIIGIISIILGFVPFCNIFAILPALVALVLGIIDWVKKHKAGAPKGKAIAGTICAALALIIIPISYIVVAAVGTSIYDSYDYDTYDYDTYDYDTYDYDTYDYDYDWDY